MQFSEAWATAYIQILIALFVFAMGILALAIPTVGDDVRKVFHRRRKATLSYIYVASILAIFIVFIWFSQPFFNKSKPDKDFAVSISIVPNTPPPTNQSTRPERLVLTSGQSQLGTDEASVLPSLVASLVMTVITIGLAITLVTYSTYLNRRHIIRHLEKVLVRKFSNAPSTKKSLRKLLARMLFRIKSEKGPASDKSPASQPNDRKLRQHHLDKDTLSDLIYLGRNGRTGQDKKLVFDVLDRIAYRVQMAQTYQGDELENLIRGLRDILSNDEQPGDDDNFFQAVELLKQIRYRLSQNPSASKYIDAGLANTVLAELGVEAVRARSGQIAQRFLQEASSFSEILFEMGLIALSARRFHTATLALNQLETLAESKGLAACSATFDLLGLLAHFAFSGTASRMRANSFLSENISDFSPSIDYCLDKAFFHHYENSNFESADMVFQLRRELSSS